MCRDWRNVLTVSTMNCQCQGTGHLRSLLPRPLAVLSSSSSSPGGNTVGAGRGGNFRGSHGLCTYSTISTSPIFSSSSSSFFPSSSSSLPCLSRFSVLHSLHLPSTSHHGLQNRQNGAMNLPLHTSFFLSSPSHPPSLPTLCPSLPPIPLPFYPPSHLPHFTSSLAVSVVEDLLQSTPSETQHHSPPPLDGRSNITVHSI